MKNSTANNFTLAQITAEKCREVQRKREVNMNFE